MGKNNIQQPLMTNFNVGNISYEGEKGELGSTRTGELMSSGMEDHLPNIELSPADLNIAFELRNR